MVYLMEYLRDPKSPLRPVMGKLIKVTEPEAVRLLAEWPCNHMTATDAEIRCFAPKTKPVARVGGSDVKAESA